MSEPLKLDLGCGVRKQPGFLGVDVRAFPGVDVVCDLTGPWPWADNSVDEVFASHVVEHFTAAQRIHVFNELGRVLKPGARATVITPHWASGRAYGDLTHQWPPVTEFFYFYLNRAWREGQPGQPETANAPHNDFYTCDFDHVCGHGLHPALLTRGQEFQAFALQFYKEAAQDLHTTLVKK